MKLLNYFIKFVKVESTSDPECSNYPSTECQKEMMKIIKKEMDAIGVKGIINKFGNYIAHLKGNPKLSSIGLCAHVDTASEFNGKNVNPQIIKNYKGNKIQLGKTDSYLDPKIFPTLLKHKGKTLVTTDGTSLLGADDKAGVAIILDVAKNYLKLDIEKRHPLNILFTCDEEIGQGAKHFYKEEFQSDFGFTLDGGDIEEIAAENFYAYQIKTSFFGNSIHPGEGKGKLKNSIFILRDFLNELDIKKTPFNSEKREGYYHVTNITSGVEESKVNIILRSFEMDEMKSIIKFFENIFGKLQKKYGKLNVKYNIKEQYKNMYPLVSKHKEIFDCLEDAYKKNNQKFKYVPIRGGTDGATFSYKGCPTPNLPTGSYNHHGKYEYAVVEDMEKISKIILDILKQ